MTIKNEKEHMMKIMRNKFPKTNQRTGKKQMLPGLFLGVAVMFQCHHAAGGLASDSLTYHLNTKMTNNTADPNPKGRISGALSSKGSVENESLKISLTELNPNTDYTLIAFVGDTSGMTGVTNFTTDSRGSFTVSLWQKSKGTAHGIPLPDALDPITNIREVQVLDIGANIVLDADLTAPTSFSYATKRAMDNTGVLPAAFGSLQLSGSPRSTKASVIASGLTPSTSYQLMVNGVSVTTKTSDAHGRLSIAGPKVGLQLVLDVRTVELADAGNTVILTTDSLGVPSTFITGSQGAVVLGAASKFA